MNLTINIKKTIHIGPKDNSHRVHNQCEVAKF
jgi:hypothetical protein